MSARDFFRRQSASPDVARVRVVAHRPIQRAVSFAAFGLIMAAAAVGGYFLGISAGDLDREYLHRLEQLEEDSVRQLQRLRSQLVDAELNRQVTTQASTALREDIVRYREDAAALQEEVTFYQSLMDPSSVERGLQIAQFELAPADGDNQFSYHLLLTRMEARRDWVHGDVRMVIRGALDQEKQVFSLTEIAQVDVYPLKYRFRYFQDLSGMLVLPPGFLPEAVEVTVSRRGNRQENLQRTFEWPNGA